MSADSIWIKKLTQKVSDMGISGRMFNWIKSFLCQRHEKVRYKSSTSKYVQMRNGLPQTAVINCFLFNIMINDQLKNSSVPLISNALLLQTILSSYQLIRTLILQTWMSTKLWKFLKSGVTKTKWLWTLKRLSINFSHYQRSNIQHLFNIEMMNLIKKTIF